MSQSIRKNHVSPLANCGFVLHFLTLPLLAVYAIWATVPEATLHEWDVTYYPPKEWSIFIPTSLLCSFVGMLFLNAAMNVMITPRPDSIDTMWDEHSRPFREESVAVSRDTAGLPEICDIDVGVINDLVQRNLISAH